MNEDNALTGAETPSLQASGHLGPDPSELGPLIECREHEKLDLIPLHPNSKKPQGYGWQNLDRSGFDPEDHMRRGGNVGIRLDAGHLLVDVDPRRFPEGETLNTDNPFRRLCGAAGINADNYPTVRTGGGGLHLYMRKPEGGSIATKLTDYPGVEFKTKGTQVVAPGSVHPGTGKRYRWENECGIDFIGIPSAPDTLLKLVAKSEPRPATKSANEAEPGAEALSPEQIETMLDALDPEDFREHDRWFRLMCSCHEASDGTAEDAFVIWSASDPAYAHDEESVRNRWRSLGRPRPGIRITTRRTLYDFLHKAGRSELVPVDADVLPDPDPMTVARAMLEELPPMVRSGQQWFEYDSDRNVYVRLENEETAMSIFLRWISGRRYLDDRGRLRALATKGSVINDVVQAAKALSIGPSQPHCWLDKRLGDPPAEEVIICANGLLHVPTQRLLPGTPRFFGVNSTPVRYDPEAPKPERFLKFMEEIFPNEADCREGIMEMAGLLLTRDTSHHKIFQIIGPPRSGKGTLMRIILKLVGEGNYTSPSTSDLAGSFALAPLVNKQVAVLSDIRMGKHTSRSNILELLLKTAGQDSVSVNRKHIDPIETRLTTRFVLVSNEVLQLRDNSDAIGTRMILYVMRQSFVGREDTELEQKLSTELPGILNMALDGLERLRRRGNFEQPRSAQTEVEMMQRATSPLRYYAKERLVTGSGYLVDKKRLYLDFEEWCLEEDDVNYTGGISYFFTDLRSAGIDFQEKRGRAEDGKRTRLLVGVGLKSDHPF